MFGTFPSRAKTDNLATVSWFPEEKVLGVKSFNNDVFFRPPPPPINFEHGSHKYHVDIIGHVAAAP